MHSSCLPQPRATATADRGPKIGDPFDIGGSEPPQLLARSTHAVAGDPKARVGTFISPQCRFLHRVGPHPVRDAFEQGGLREEIMALCQTSGLEWQAIGLYRQGVADDPNENPPTVIITVGSLPSPAVLAMATRLVDRTEELLGRQFPDVHVEAITYRYADQYASSTAARDGDDGSGITFVDSIFAEYSTVPPGRSIGPAATTGTGSLSGYVRVRCPAPATGTTNKDIGDETAASSMTAGARMAVFGLTCHHVAAFGRPDALAALSLPDAVQMTSPAGGDHALYLDNLRTRHAEMEELIADRRKLQKQQESTEKDTSFVGREIASLESTTERLGRIVSHVTEAWSTNPSFGTVVQSSGIRQPATGSSTADWAVIQPFLQTYQQQRKAKKIDPVIVMADLEEKSLARKVCQKLRVPPPAFISDLHAFFNPCIELPLVPKARIHALCRASDDEDPVYVYLRGRTTPFGVGVLHDTHDGVRTKYQAGDGAEREIISTELVVLDVRRGGTGCPLFSSRGDSGAPVRLADGSVLGFVLASVLMNESRPVTYVAVGKTVVEDIAQALGAEEVCFVGSESLED